MIFVTLLCNFVALKHHKCNAFLLRMFHQFEAVKQLFKRNILLCVPEPVKRSVQGLNKKENYCLCLS